MHNNVASLTSMHVHVFTNIATAMAVPRGGGFAVNGRGFYLQPHVSLQIEALYYLQCQQSNTITDRQGRGGI